MRKHAQRDSSDTLRKFARGRCFLSALLSRFAHMNKSDLMSTAEAAAELRVSIATLNRRAATGLIEVAVQMPGHTGARLYARDEIERLKAEIETAA